MHIRDNFSAGAPISQVPASWFASVAKFINGLIGGNGISLIKHDDGTPSLISLSGDVATLTSVAPEEVGTSAAVGTGEAAAREDHVHALPAVNGWTGDQTLTDMITLTPTQSNTAWRLDFYAPIFDKHGRYKGLSSSVTTSAEFLAG